MIALGSLPFVGAALLAVLARAYGAKRLVFALTPAIALLLAGEIGLRLWFTQADRDLQQILAPAKAGRWAGGELFRPHHYSLFSLAQIPRTASGRRHNSLGFRDHREFATDPEAIRIVFIGGSTTYTLGVADNDEIFTARLERHLNSRYRELLGNWHVEVVNAGLPQATSAENLIRLAFLVSHITPAVVVIQHGINDGWPRAAGGLQPDYGNYRKTWSRPAALQPGQTIAASVTAQLRFHSMLAAYAMYKTRLVPLLSVGDFVTQSGLKFAPANLVANGSEVFSRNTRMMVALAQHMGAEVVLANIAVDADRVGLHKVFVPEHNRVMRDIAEADQILFFDFANRMVTDAGHMPDGRHVSQRGSDLKADLWFEFLTEHKIVPRAAGSRATSGTGS
jgi:lysophospholipase L1-like esterase